MPLPQQNHRLRFCQHKKRFAPANLFLRLFVHTDFNLPQFLRKTFQNCPFLIGYFLILSVLIAYPVFHARPEIHRNRANLNLYRIILCFFQCIDGHANDDMIALITVFLWILYIIPLPNDQNACLFAYSRYDAVNIIFKVTNDPDARNIGQFISRHLNRDRQFLLFQLLRDADLAFDSLLNIMYRIFPAPTSVLRIQAVQPNLNDRQRLFIWLDQTVVFFL